MEWELLTLPGVKAIFHSKLVRLKANNDCKALSIISTVFQFQTGAIKSGIAR